MHTRTLPWPLADVCWNCQWRITSQRRKLALLSGPRQGTTSVSRPRVVRRAFHATELCSQIEPSTPANSPQAINPAILDATRPVRQRLKLWQEELGGPNAEELRAFENYLNRDEISNGMNNLNLGAKSDEGYRAGEREEDPDDEGEDLITIGLFLKPGDVVEISQSGREPVLAVFVQQIDIKSQLYSVNGRWCHALLPTISFAIPGCIDPALVQPLVPFLPTRPDEASTKSEIQVPRELGGPVQQVLERLVQDSERIYRENATILDNAYSALADQTRTRMMTLTQIAKTLLAPHDRAWTPTPAALLAVRKALHHNEFRFRSDARSQRLTNVFAIRPKSDVELVETVQAWVREFEEHRALTANVNSNFRNNMSRGATYVAQFAEKARRLVATSRKYRDPLPGFVGPSKDRSRRKSSASTLWTTWGEEFSSTDKKIINFLQAWVLSAQYRNMHGLHSACTTILEATGSYGDIPEFGHWDPNDRKMGTSAGHLFLQEIGVISPHENRTLYDEQLMLPTVRLSRNLELLHTKAELTRGNPDFTDSMADLRQDWGAMDVYCIDDIGAKEIDDGVSITGVSGKTSEFWVHVHVANPTAFFDKTHVLSGLAAHMTETVYTPERSFPMLPTWVTQNYFSLDRDRPVLTFSTRVDLSGAILERKVQPGIIRRATRITPTQLSELLGESQGETPFRLVVGGEVPVTHQTASLPKLSTAQLQDLRHLYDVARMLWDTRKAAGGVRINNNKMECRVYEKPGQGGLTWSPPSTDRARLVHGDPIIELTTRTSSKDAFVQTISARNIVEELMLLACETAASWCAERNIPVMFRGTIESPVSGVQSLEHFQTSIVQPYLERHGQMSNILALQYLDALGRSIAHFSPIPHRIIGVQSYVKVTSPLRRFSDMIAHWQMEAAIRHEAQTGQRFDQNKASTLPRSILPFSQRQMQESIVTLSPREKLISSAKGKSNHFWLVMAFMRAFYYKEAPLPDTFRIWIRWVHNAGHPIGFISGYNVKIEVAMSTDRDIRLGDEWEARIVNINIYQKVILMEPLNLLHREDWVK